AGRCSTLLAPFWSLAAGNPDLFQKLGQDPLLDTYFIYGFFPGVYEQVYLTDQPAVVNFDGRTRGWVALFASEQGGLVVKPTQSRREEEIARIAGELKAGPLQYPSLPGFITEEYIPGTFFTQLPTEQLRPEAMYRVGMELGGMLSRLHLRRIFYNDTTLSDSEGRSHLLVSPAVDGDCRLIDFGVSLLLDRHPQLSLEEVYNFARTLPEFRLLSGMVASDEAMTQFLGQYRQRLAGTSPEQIMERDVRFFQEGLRLAARRLGDSIIEPLRRGFGEAYLENS
ncbi:MAG: hypothetical protein ACE5Q6_01395, partial [Dehalococcoidia bacterium]